MGAASKVSLTGAEVRAWRLQYGWSGIELSVAHNYTPTTWYCVERGHMRLPESIYEWMQTVPPPPRGRHSWGADWTYAAKLRRYLRRSGLRISELGVFTHRAETSAYRWVAGITQPPLIVCAWIDQGCPDYWMWDVYGFEREHPARVLPLNRGLKGRTLSRFVKGRNTITSVSPQR
jgi:hypothetical protein